MKLVIQRVQHAEVVINAQLHSRIDKGLLVLVGVHEEDSEQDADWLAGKLCNMRIFQDENDKMNLSVMDVAGDILAVSQFTLYASTTKGNRPSFIEAARPELATRLYDYFCDRLSMITQKETQKGVFGADMKVSLLNDGPVTIVIDSKNKS